MENRRRSIDRALLGIATVWASLAIVFVVTGGGDSDSVQMLHDTRRHGLGGPACPASGSATTTQSAWRSGFHQAPGRSFRRLAVLAAVGGVLLAATVLIFTPRGLADWALGAAGWAAGFGALAAADTLGWRKSRRRLHQEPPSPGSTGYPSR